MPTLSSDERSAASQELRIGEWTLDAANNELRRKDESVRLEPKVIELLAYLAGRAGTAVGREELLSTVWPGVIVGDDALTQAIIKLRKALGDDAHHPKYIETISKRGYRLIAPVVQGGKPPPSVMAARASFLRRNRVVIAAAGAIVALTVGALLAFPEIARTVGMPWPIVADTKGGAVATSLPTVAILPLANLSGDPKREYFSDGVTEDIINALGRFSGVRVMSRNAVQGFKGKSPSPQTIRNELGARYIVQGSVREADGKVRVAVELSDAEQGALLWSERYDAEGTQLFEIQDRIVKNIVGNLQVKLTQLERTRVFTRPTDSLEAYDLVLRARSLLDRSERSANREARALLARAQKLAPEYGEIFTELGEADFQRGTYGWMEDASEGMRRAEEFAQRALASVDPRAHTRAHALLATISSQRGQFEEALGHTVRAIELNPSDSRALYRRGGVLLYVGRIDEAIAVLETASRFEPRSIAGAGINLVIAYYTAGRYREALAEADALVARTPHLDFLHAARAAALSQLGKADEARQAADQVRRFNPYFQVENFGTRFVNPEHTTRLQEGLRKAGL
ncbi:MAG: winged helix-turn-helix domain-containing protein [Burkholderiales bacterium]